VSEISFAWVNSTVRNDVSSWENTLYVSSMTHFSHVDFTTFIEQAATQKMSQSAHINHHHQPTPHSKVSRDGPHRILSITGAQLNLQWDSLRNVEYLTDGGNNWIHTAVLNGKSVVVKTLKPECQDVALAINEIEGELEVHSRLDHPNVVKLIGAGFTPRGVRFVVMERLDGGTLTQLLGYDNRIRDRRRRFWTKKKLSYMDVLKYARSLAEALAYLHGRAIPNVMVLHRDLKPDNIGESPYTTNYSVIICSIPFS
jgi:serine/threonine protein kinase